jgi:tocopherol O-methyltransferase
LQPSGNWLQLFEMTSHRSIKERVRRYYLATTEDYLKYYATDWHQHMHYGFDRDLPRGGNPTENLVRYLADCAGLKAGDRVLDAGCGVGGSSIWLARHRQVQSLGLNLMAFQAALARNYAGDSGAHFTCGDFMVPPFRDASFDTVWAIESFDHAPDKAEWMRVMATKLRPGGRIAIADGFRSEGDFSPPQAKAYADFLRGWAVPHLCTTAELLRYGRDAGLELMHEEDITTDVMPHAFAIYRFAFLFVPGRWLLRKLGLTSEEKLLNATATWHQYRTLKQGLWSYRVAVFRKG